MTADHGDLMGAHGMYCKGYSAAEEIYNIPLIVAGPGVARGVVTPARVGLHDLCPTLLELTGCEGFDAPDSQSFANLLKDPARQAGNFTTGFAEYYGSRIPMFQRIIWKGRFKYVLNGFDFDELYDLETDHGEMAGRHGCWSKSNYYEGSAGVPLVVRWPGVVEAGSQCDAICNLIDIGATLIDVASGRPLPNSDGRSLLPWWRGETPCDWRQETFGEFVDKSTHLPSAMIRSTRWKLWKYAEDSPPTLFDLETDPDEMNDLGASPEHAETRDRLLKRLMEVWDPDRVARENPQQNTNVQILRDWAKVVRPDHPDTACVPTNWQDGDIEMLS